MAIGIHHGSNGSFKTAGVMNDFYVPAALSGRVVVTNIRGVSRQNTMLKLLGASDKHDVLFVDTDTMKGRLKIATWFKWVPIGALLLFDEAGVCFPKAWSKSDIAKLDFESGVVEYCDIHTKEHIKEELNGIDYAEFCTRPANWDEAWQKHRHWNWDIVLTAPNIKYIRDDIRLTSEGGYKHKNKALLGPMFKGYKEGYHDAQKNGQSSADFDNVVDKRIPSSVFDLYESTRTSVFTSTFNGFNLFLSPRLLFPLAIAVAAFTYSFGSGGYEALINGPQTVKTVNSAPVPVQPDKVFIPSVADSVVESVSLGGLQSLSKAFDSAGSDVDSRKPVFTSNLAFGPLGGSSIRIEAGIKLSKRYVFLFDVSTGESSRSLTLDDVLQMGYSVKPSSICKAKISYRGSHLDVYCHSYNSIAKL